MVKSVGFGTSIKDAAKSHFEENFFRKTLCCELKDGQN